MCYLVILMPYESKLAYLVLEAMFDYSASSASKFPLFLGLYRDDHGALDAVWDRFTKAVGENVDPSGHI